MIYYDVASLDHLDSIFTSAIWIYPDSYMMLNDAKCHKSIMYLDLIGPTILSLRFLRCAEQIPGAMSVEVGCRRSKRCSKP